MVNNRSKNSFVALLVVLLCTLATACAAPTDPNQNDDAEDQPDQPDDSALLVPAVEPPHARVIVELGRSESTLA